jgi:hypothetical protein
VHDAEPVCGLGLVMRAAVPERSELDPAALLILNASIVSDIALRTVLGSVMSAAVLTGALRAQRDTDRFYAELAGTQDPALVFTAPPEVKINATSRRGPDAPGIHVDVLSFQSPYVALNPAVREQYAAHIPNRTAYAQHWRHDDGPRQTLCVIHGFGASPAWFNSRFFSLPEFFADGWDVVLFTLPFHGARRGTPALMNGAELFAHGTAHITEGLIHAIHDFRVLLDYLHQTGAPRVGVTGLSLGGYITATLAAVDPRLDFAIPNVPAVSLPGLASIWFPIGHALSLARTLTRTPTDLADQAMAIHSPLNYPPVLPKDRLLLVGGLGDRLAPPSQTLQLWEHWNRPQLHWFLGNHLLHFGRRRYLEDMRTVMNRPTQKETQ